MAGGKQIKSSNMEPTIGVQNRQTAFAMGALGRDLFIPCVLHISEQMRDFRMSLKGTFHSLRLDASHRGRLRADSRLVNS